MYIPHYTDCTNNQSGAFNSERDYKLTCSSTAIFYQRYIPSIKDITV